MIQDIAPHIFKNEFSNRLMGENDYYIILSDHRELLGKLNQGKLILPSAKEQGSDQSAIHLFDIDDTGYFLSEKIPEGYVYLSSKDLRTIEDPTQRFAAVTAVSIGSWFINNRYCGHCGTRMVLSDKERMVQCPNCGNMVYPKICPVIIAGIIHDNKLLLVKYANRGRYARYSLIAGFAEFGEAIEQTVRREIKEETDLSVKNIHYFGSQPWAFSDSLIMGFFCELDGKEEFVFNDHELGEGKWSTPEEIECDQTDYVSITQLMKQTFKKYGNKVLSMTVADL